MQRAIAEHRVVLTDLHTDSEGRNPHMGAIAPVALGDGSTPIGAIVLVVDAATFLYPLVQSWPTPSESAETLIVERDGDEVIFLNELRHQQGTALTLRIPLDQIDVPAVMAVLGTEGVVEGLDYRGVPVFSVLVPVPGSPWFMVAKIDRTEVLAAWRSTSVLIVALILALVVSMAAVFGFPWQRVEKQHYAGVLAAREELAESEQRFRLLVESSPDAIFVLTEGRFAYVNSATVRLFGATGVADLLGTDLAERSHPDFRTLVRERIRLLNEKKRPVPVLDEVYLRLDGTPVPVSVSAVPIHWEGEEGALVFARDVTVRERAEQALRESESALKVLNLELEQRVAERTVQLEASNKELEAFAYSVSHDLRAPLRAIEGFSRILVEDHAGSLDTEGQRLLNVVQSNTGRMDRLITDLLELSRVSQSELKPVRIDMTEMVEDVYAEVVPLEERGRFEFVVAELPLARGDPTLVRRVWHNLISNAVKFTSTSEVRRIEVGGGDDDTLRTYFVRDSGVGFDPKYAHKLFGVFQRLHSRDEFEGTGIGLAIVQRIVRRHGGRVWAEGEVGKGATFYFALPGKEMHCDGSE